MKLEGHPLFVNNDVPLQLYYPSQASATHELAGSDVVSSRAYNLAKVRQHNGCVHMRTKHVPKDVSDRDPKRDWDRDLNYVHSHALQTPSQSRSGSAHCEVIVCSYCAVRAR